MTPIATMTGTCAVGSPVMGPGYPTFRCNGMPVSCLGDAVTGPACTGVVSSTMHPTMIIGGRPVASLTCLANGVSAVGVPVSAPIAVGMLPTLLV